jgi:hypothetical protein
MYFVVQIKNLDLTKYPIIWSLGNSHEAGDRVIKILHLISYNVLLGFYSY